MGAIVAGRLAILCGAGLSMAAPSYLPSAAEIARRCFDTHLANEPRLPVALRNDLEALADYFYGRGTLVTVFIRGLVPWRELVGPPNAGHEAIADLLLTGAINHTVTTNFDWLIERAIWDLGADFTASLDGGEAVIHAVNHHPLLKLHGCGNRERDNTLWTRRQLAQATFSLRIASLREWLSVNLREKDLLVVGFWSDWPHLTDVLEASLRDSQLASVVVVDPATSEALEGRASGLWRAFHTGGVPFEHVQMSADAFLEELREAFSRAYLRQLLQMGAAVYEETFREECPPQWLRAEWS